MEKEKIFKTLLLIGVLCTVLLVSFCYDNQEIDNTDLQWCQKGSSMIYAPNYTNYDYKETLELLPPDWLLDFYNISVEMRFYNVSVNENSDV